MEPKLRFVNFFDAESVCPGDILKNKLDRNVFYIVIWVNVEGEEWYCVEGGRQDSLSRLLRYIGFEKIEEYSKSEFESLNY
jgi:hypothetical protein